MCEMCNCAARSNGDVASDPAIQRLLSGLSAIRRLQQTVTMIEAKSERELDIHSALDAANLAITIATQTLNAWNQALSGTVTIQQLDASGAVVKTETSQTIRLTYPGQLEDLLQDALARR